jgi:uncharacterized protein involved in response to NO
LAGKDAGQAQSPGGVVIWPPYIGASLVLAATAGFSLGAALFAASALGFPLGPWWPAAAQAHGHVQVFGWAGLMVLGVGLHFLPRLRGTTLEHPERSRYALVLLVLGLALRALSQPLLALPGAAPPLTAGLRACLVGSGGLELAGVSLALWLFTGLLRRGPPLRARTALWLVLPFFLTAFTAYWLATALNLAGLIAAPTTSALIPDRIDRLTNLIAFYAFLLPISVAMSERTFPLFFRTPQPRLPRLRAGLVLLLGGLIARMAGDLAEAARLVELGDLIMAAAIALFIQALGIFAPRRPLPRQPIRPLRDPIQLHAISAYLWLAAVALVLVINGAATFGLASTSVPLDAERHLLGAGFVTLLILGVGAHLLSSFANRRPRSVALLWTTLLLGNLTALLRVGPLVFPSVLAGGGAVALPVAGITGLAALIVFGINLFTGPGL